MTTTAQTPSKAKDPTNRTILDKWAHGQSKIRPSVSLLSLFQAQTTKTPENVCLLESGSSPLNYRNVESLSWNLSKLIGERHDRVSPYIATLLPRSADMILTTLSIMKSEKTIVPLSLQHPPNYLISMMEDLDSPLLITTPEHLTKIGNYKNVLILSHDWKNQMLSRETSPDLYSDINNNQCSDTEKENKGLCETLYIFFTSGTTGKPKGVQIQPQAVSNLVHTYVETLNLKPEDRALCLHNPAFDASLVDFWPSLITGGSVWIPDEGLAYDLDQVKSFIQVHGITYANVPTVLAHAFFNSFKPGDFQSLRWLVFGGEKLKVSPPPNFPSKCLNAYGPTETTTDACHSLVDSNTDVLESIGRPLPNVNVYILKDGMEPVVSPGEDGILWIGGIGVSGGYLNRPNLNAAAFQPSPFQSGDILFCTGDVARWLHDGNICIVRRDGTQVKVNGFRVEVEEVETILLTHPSIQETVVIPVDELQGIRLVAFVVGNKGGNGTLLLFPGPLRAFLQNQLPYYAIPTEFLNIPLGSLPISSNGKIDRRNLIRLYQSNHFHHHPGSSSNLIIRQNSQPMNTLEKTLALIWSSVLKVDVLNFCKEDPSISFFALGGTSLYLGFVLRKIKEELCLDLTLQDLLAHPNLDSLAGLVTQRLRRTSRPLTPYQTFIWFHQMFELGEGNSTYHRHQLLEFNDDEDEYEIESVQAKALSIFKGLDSSLCFTTKVIDGDLSGGTVPVTKIQPETIELFLNDEGSESDDAISSLLAKEYGESFDFWSGEGPLFRSKIIINSKTHQLHLVLIWHELLDSGNVLSDLLISLEEIGIHQSYLPISFTNTEFTFSQPVSLEGENKDQFISKVSTEIWKSAPNTPVLIVQDGDDSGNQLLSLLQKQEDLSKMNDHQEDLSPEAIFRIIYERKRVIIKVSRRDRHIPQKVLKGDHGLIAYFELTVHPLIDPSSLESEITYSMSYNTNCLNSCNGVFQLNSKTVIPRIHQQLLDTESSNNSYRGTTIDTSPWWSILSTLVSYGLEIPIDAVFAEANRSFPGTLIQFLKLFCHIQSLIPASSPLRISSLFHDSSLEGMTKVLTKEVNEPRPRINSVVNVVLEHEVRHWIQSLIPSKDFRPWSGRDDVYQNMTLLLTGVTGYLGAFLLEAFLHDDRKTFKKIYVLARGGLDRLTKILIDYQIIPSNCTILPFSLIVLDSDISQPHLGLEPDLFAELASQVDLICHCAASVNLVQNYQELCGSNVVGTVSLARLALTGRPKAFCFVSTSDTTFSQFIFSPKDEVEMEETPGPPPYFYLGYYQSKWVCEQILNHVGQYVPVQLYRVGTVGAHSSRLIINPTSFDGKFLSLCLRMKSFPKFRSQFSIPYSDVDFAAKMIMNLVRTTVQTQSPTCVTLNIVQKDYFIPRLLRNSCEPVSPQIWYQHFENFILKWPDETLRIILEEAPWARVAPGIKNMIEYLDRMPAVCYPVKTALNLCRDFDPEFQIPPKPRMDKYIKLHLAAASRKM